MPWQPNNNVESAQRASERAELAAILDKLEPNSRYKVARTLRDAPSESTQVVYRNDGAGPYIRKTFANDTHRGIAYQAILNAQEKGFSFSHQPYIYECHRDAEKLTVIMECVSGETLAQSVTRMGPSVSLALRIGAQLCDAMSELHNGFAPSIIHRDIKPSNIMVSGNRFVLIDLGIARVVRQEAQNDTVRFGTPGYAPPEQFGYGQTTAQSDIYAAGMVMAYCLIGRDCPANIREKGFRDTRIPANIQSILQKATAFDPKQRFNSAQEMKAAILQCCNQAKTTQLFQNPFASNAWNSTYSNPAIGNNRNASPVFPAANGPLANAGAQKEPSKVRVPTNRIYKPKWLGVFWNMILAMYWILILSGCIMSMSIETEQLAFCPTWYRVTVLAMVIMIPGTLLMYLLADKRRIRPKIPFIANLTWRQELPFCLITSFASVIIACIIGVVALTF